MTLSIADFLNARLAEDEAAARAVPTDGAPWHDQWVNDDGYALRTVNDHVLAYGHHGEPMKPGLLDHIARHDPARVLREVTAKRAIIELHGRSHECSTYDHNGDVDHCSWCLDPEDCSTLKALAAIYADHAEYNPEWAVA